MSDKKYVVRAELEKAARETGFRTRKGAERHARILLRGGLKVSIRKVK